MEKRDWLMLFGSDLASKFPTPYFNQNNYNSLKTRGILLFVFFLPNFGLPPQIESPIFVFSLKKSFLLFLKKKKKPILTSNIFLISISSLQISFNIFKILSILIFLNFLFTMLTLKWKKLHLPL